MPQESRQESTIRPSKADKERIEKLKEAYGCPTDIGAVRLALIKATEAPRFAVAVSEELHEILQGFESWEVEAMLREALALRQSKVEWLDYVKEGEQ